MRISIELVPRDEEQLSQELAFTKNHFPIVDTINIPDLLRFDIRSWQGCVLAKQYFQHAIPHIRSIDVPLNGPLPMTEELVANQIDEVLILTGDPPQDMTRKIYSTTSTELIQKFKKELPNIKIYAAIDQYRSSVRKEREYIKRKIDAGAAGFFTQPFFDLRFMEIYAELLEGTEVFWGVSPVTSEKSHNYWETKNNVVFPKGFEPTLEWNIEFAQKALAFTRRTNTNVYFMPIKTNVETYLTSVLNS